MIFANALSSSASLVNSSLAEMSGIYGYDAISSGTPVAQAGSAASAATAGGAGLANQASTVLKEQGFPAVLGLKDTRPLTSNKPPNSGESTKAEYTDADQRYSPQNLANSLARGAMAAGLQYDPQNGYRWLDFEPSSAASPQTSGPAWFGLMPSLSPEAAVLRLNQLLSDSRFTDCGSDANSGPCKAAREESEKLMVTIMDSIDVTRPNSIAMIANWAKQLDLARTQVGILNATLRGDPVMKSGLLSKVATLQTEAIPQFDSLLTTAYNNVLAANDQRRALFVSEQDRLTNEQKTGAASVQTLAAKMARVNLAKAGTELFKSTSKYGAAVFEAGAGATEMIRDVASGLSDLRKRYSEWGDEYLGMLDDLRGQGKSVVAEARGDARLMNATFKGTEQLLLMAAKRQGKDRTVDVKKMFVSAGKSANSTISKFELAASRNSTNAFLDAGQALNNTIYDSGPVLVDLGQKSTNLLQQGLSSINGTIENALQSANSLAANANLKAIYMDQLGEDVAKLGSDSATAVSKSASLVDDLRAELLGSFLSNYSEVADVSADLFGNIVKTVAGGIEGLQSDLGKIANGSLAAAAAIKASSDQSTSALAGRAATDSTNTVSSFSAANLAIRSLLGLTDAKLKLSSDSSGSSLSDSARILQSAMAAEGDSVGEIAAAARQDSELAKSRIGGQISTAFTNSNAQLDRQSESLLASVSEYQASTMAESSEAKTGVRDARNANSAADMALQRVAGQFEDANTIVSSLTDKGNSDFETMMRQLAGQDSLIGDTRKAVETGLSTAAQSQLSAYAAELARLTTGSLLGAQIRSTKDVLKQRMEANRPLFHAPAVDGIVKELQSISGLERQLAPVLLALRNNETGYLLGRLREASVAMATRMDSARTEEIEGFNADLASTQQAVARMGNATEIQLKEWIAGTLGELGDAKKILHAISVRPNPMPEISAAVDRIKASFAKLTQSSDAFATNARANQTLAIASALEYLANKTKAMMGRKSSSEGDERIDQIRAALDAARKTLADVLTNSSAQMQKMERLSNSRAEFVHGRFLDVVKSLGVAVVDTKTRIAEKEHQASIAATEKQRMLLSQLSALLAGLGDSDSSVSSKIAAASLGISAQLARADSDSDSALQRATSGDLQNAISAENSIDTHINQIGPDLSQSEAVLAQASSELQSTPVDRSQAYKLQGLLGQLSDRSKQRVLTIMRNLDLGNLSLDDAIAQARQLDLSHINSVDDALVLLAVSAHAYQAAVNQAFAGSQERLQATTELVDGRLTYMTQGLLRQVTDLNATNDALETQISQFATNSSSALQNDTAIINAIKNQIETDRTSVSALLSNLAESVDTYEGSLKSNETDYETWVDSTIAKELEVANVKAQALRASSLLQRKANSKSVHLHAFERDMHELVTRRTRRVRKGHVNG